MGGKHYRDWVISNRQTSISYERPLRKCQTSLTKMSVRQWTFNGLSTFRSFPILPCWPRDLSHSWCWLATVQWGHVTDNFYSTVGCPSNAQKRLFFQKATAKYERYLRQIFACARGSQQRRANSCVIGKVAAHSSFKTGNQDSLRVSLHKSSRRELVCKWGKAPKDDKTTERQRLIGCWFKRACKERHI